MTIPRSVCPLLACLGAVGAMGFALAAPLGATIETEGAIWTLGVVLPVYAIGAFAWTRRPDLPIARLILAAGSCLLFAEGMTAVIEGVRDVEGAVEGLVPPAVLTDAVRVTGAVLGATALAVFPDGRAVRALERLALAAMWIFPAAALLQLVTAEQFRVVADGGVRDEAVNPLGVDPLFGLDPGVERMMEIHGVVLAVAVVVLALRYRRLDHAARLQVRWVLVLAVVGAGLVQGLWALESIGRGFEIAGYVVGFATLLVLPAVVLVAILGHRPFEVDRLLRRSVVYGALWLAIAAACVGAAVSLGLGGREWLLVVIVAALAVIATLAFRPARRRLERIVDRWAFGPRDLGEIRARAKELRVSRRRLRTAGDRDLHDRVQRRLLALIVRARRRRPDAELQHEAGLLLADLRELAGGAHPPLLRDHGLVEAIAARAGRMPIPVSIHADPASRAARFPDEIEGAAYFVASEALANVLKHSRARRAAVRVACANGVLELDVQDDGVGFEPGEAAGRGLSSMAERVESLGGRLGLSTGSGEGTRVSAALPALKRAPVHA